MGNHASLATDREAAVAIVLENDGKRPLAFSRRKTTPSLFMTKQLSSTSVSSSLFCH
jgi:hypothetical protein